MLEVAWFEKKPDYSWLALVLTFHVRLTYGLDIYIFVLNLNTHVRGASIQMYFVQLIAMFI